MPTLCKWLRRRSRVWIPSELKRENQSLFVLSDLYYNGALGKDLKGSYIFFIKSKSKCILDHLAQSFQLSPRGGMAKIQTNKTSASSWLVFVWALAIKRPYFELKMGEYFKKISSICHRRHPKEELFHPEKQKLYVTQKCFPTWKLLVIMKNLSAS